MAYYLSEQEDRIANKVKEICIDYDLRMAVMLAASIYNILDEIEEYIDSNSEIGEEELLEFIESICPVEE